MRSSPPTVVWAEMRIVRSALSGTRQRDVLGVSVQYAAQYDAGDDAPRWELLWRRRDSVNKPLTDAVMAARTLNVLEAIVERCPLPKP